MARHLCGRAFYGRCMARVSLDSPPIAGIVVELVSEVAGTMLVSTGLLAGVMRALSILRRSPAEQVELLTAAGFAGGLAFGTLILVLDLVLG
jgi:hypothetical protein